MATRAHAQAEPIPGYRLIERLGGGGFGEVWKCEAPGGLLKAIKFVHGSLQGSVSEEAGAHQELKSLKRVQAIRHPYILSLERYDIVDGQLMIIMELADKNLWERHKECVAQGHIGIPREELLRYMEEAGEALDLMNIQYGLQHLDIKPQNLFLVHNHVKVADFGLVKDLEGMNTQVTGGVTPVYAAPETFDGVISRYCDQYNLAIVYQELLTGQRPFAGTNVRQLLMQHLTGTPDLTSLPPCDKEIIARALSKKPEDRYPSCTDMVQALRQAGLTASLLKRDLTPAIAKAKAAMPEAPTPVNSSAGTQSPTPVSAPLPVPAAPMTVAGPLNAPMAPAPTMSQIPPTMSQMMRPPSAHSFTIPVPPRRPTVLPPKPEVTGDGVLFPALVVGIGGMGLRVLRQLRHSLHECCGSVESLPNVSFIYIDTDPETVSQALAGPQQTIIHENEIVLARLNKPSHYLKPGRGRVSTDAWLNMGMLCRVPRNQVTPDGLRMMGRLAFADNARSIVGKIKTDIAAVTATNALSGADRETRLGLRSNKPRVYVAAGMGGGTGSGMFIDVAYVLRRELVRQGYPDPEIIGLLLLPAADRNSRKNPALVNAFAALTELNHFSTPGITYVGHLDDGDEALTDGAPPFTRCITLGLPEEGGDASLTEDVMSRGADLISRELATRLGRSVDKARSGLPEPEEGVGMLCQTFGSYKYSMPRQALMDRVGQALTVRLVRSWLSPAPGMQKALRNRITEETIKRDLTKEAMIQSLQAACEKALEISPETAFDTIVHENYGPGDANEPQAALEALNLVEQIIGHPQEDENAPPESTPMIEALDEAARHIRADWERQLVDFIKSLVDDPRFRMAGAEEANQQIMAMFSEVIRQHGSLLEELYARAEEAYLTIESSVEDLRKGSWWPGRKNKLADDLRTALVVYPKSRYQGLVLECLLEVYQQLLDKLPKKLEEVAFARQRLTEFVKYLDDRGEGGGEIHLGPGRHFLPGECQTIEEAVDAVDRAMGAEELQQLDQKVQAIIRKQYKSLMAVCMASAETMKELKVVIQDQAMSYVDAQLGKESIAAMYLEQHTDDNEISDDISSAFEQSNPTLAGNRSHSPELRFMVTSRDPAGDRLGKLAKQVDEEVQIVTVEGASDVFFYRERSQMPLADLPQLGLMAEDAYRQMTSPGHFTPHTRTDITEWKAPG